MQPWIIALSGIIVAALAAGGSALPWLEVTPHSALAASAMAHVPTLLIVALAAYALATLLLTTTTWVSELWRLRAHLARLADMPKPTPRDITAICAATRLRRLATWLYLEPGEPMPPRAGGVLETAAMPEALRGEISWLHHTWLARTQFYSALALLVALVTFGAAEHYQPFVSLPSAVPTIWAALALIGLFLLALLARLTLDATIEPVVEELWRLCAGRRAAKLAEPAHKLTGPLETALAAALKELAQRLVAAVDSRRDAALGAAAKLAAATETAGAALRSSVEALNASLGAAIDRLPAPLAEPTAGLAELQAAIERLITALARLAQLAEISAEEAARNPRHPVADENMARELARLLREMDAKN